MRSFLHAKIPKAQTTGKSSVPFALLGTACTKAAFKMLKKVTPGLNFINVLRTAFLRGTQKRKKYSQVFSLFTLSGSTSIKAACKMLKKLTPGVIYVEPNN